jgi:hypothetical protein
VFSLRIADVGTSFHFIKKSLFFKKCSNVFGNNLLKYLAWLDYDLLGLTGVVVCTSHATMEKLCAQQSATWSSWAPRINLETYTNRFEENVENDSFSVCIDTANTAYKF